MAEAGATVTPRVTRPQLGAQFEGILAAAQAGGEWAVAALYRALHPAVLRYFRSRAGQEAEDLASETWLDVARGLPGFAGSEEAFRSWVFTIAHRRLVDHHRSARRRPVTTGADQSMVAVPAADDPAATVLDGVAGDAAVRRLWELLSPEQAEIVVLRVVGDLSAEDVARITGRRVGAVRVAQHRALRRLAQKLEGAGGL
jgi:RNA polymerase sigma factor (sigma-70 family)